MTLYLTLLLGKVLPASLRRVVYIDADCIVRRDPKHLFELTLTEPIAACGHFGTPFIGSADLLLPWKSLGMEGTAKYFNLGLLVIDLDAWRADATQDQLLQIARRYGDDLDWLSQDVFNLAFYGRWMELSPTWNAFWKWIRPDSPYFALRPRSEVEEIIIDPAVVHFSGDDKPWANIVDAGDPTYLLEWRQLAAQVTVHAPELATKPRNLRTLISGLVYRTRRAAHILRHGY